MPSRNLPVNIDSGYADDATHPDVKVHQQHHDVVHAFVNLWDDAAPGNGFIPFFNTSNGLWEYIDPAIAGSPGPKGDDGHGIRFLGAWDNGTTYYPYDGPGDVFNDDAVEYLGRVFVALTISTGATPPSTATSDSNWQLFADKGTTGATGADGAQGVPGVDGTDGADGFILPIPFIQDGMAAVTDPGGDSLPWVVPVNMNIDSIIAVGSRGPDTVPVEFDVLYDGYTVFANPADRPTLPVGEIVGTAVPATGTVQIDAGHIVTIDVTVVGPETEDPAVADVPTGAGNFAHYDTAAGTTTTAYWQIPIPANVQAGDEMVCFFVNGTTTTPTAYPSGWVNAVTEDTTVTVLEDDGSPTMNLYAIKKVASGSESNDQRVTYSTATAPVQATTVIVRHAAAHGAQVDDSDTVNSAGGNATTVTVPALVTAENDEVVLVAACERFSNGTQADCHLPSPLTEIATNCTTRGVGNTNFSLVVGFEIAATAGTFGGYATSVSPSTSARWAGADIGLKSDATASDSPGDNVGVYLNVSRRLA